MITLVFLLISIIVTSMLMYAVPIGLTRKEKNIALAASAAFGSLGLVSVNFAEPWQVLSMIVLLGASAGYIIINRLSATKEPVKISDRLHSKVDEESFNLKGRMNNFAVERELSAIAVLSAQNSNHETLKELKPSIAEDATFLDERNEVHIHQVEWVKPAANMDLEDWMVEPEKEKVYASTHS
jgi:uncharacterized membrane protein